MQNRGLIKFFAILFALVCIYQLSFTFVASREENKAKLFAKGDSKKELSYLDSIGKQKVFLGIFTYNDVRDKKINKGLDLEGGINVQLQISVKDILKGLSNNSKNPIFEKSIADASTNLVGGQNYIDAFFDAFETNSKGKVKLSDPTIFANKSLQEEVKFEMNDKETEKVIRTKVEQSVASAFEVLRKRIDKFGVTQPNIQKLGESGRILVELPGAKDVDRAKKLLSSTAQLEFWETYKIDEIGQFLMSANDVLKKTELKTKDVVAVKKDSLTELLTDKKDSTDIKAEDNPLLGKIIGQGGGPIVGIFAKKDTAAVGGYLRRSDIRVLLQGNQRYAKFVWGIPASVKDDKTKQDIETFALYALKGTRDNVAPMGGGVITDAKDDFDQFGKPAVSMQMNGRGANKWEELTGRAYTQKSAIAIVLDNVVYSAPGVSSGPISGGRSQISGSFDITETKDLANVLRAGKLPASADIIQSEVVGPSLGQEAIDAGVTSSLVGLLLVSLWMIIYYGRAGVYANIALAVNILFLFGFMASFPGFVLTLPGIAGIVLTMGTAVDANIIIYERAKEELRLGKTLEEAINVSYSWKGAMRSTLDACITPNFLPSSEFINLS